MIKADQVIISVAVTGSVHVPSQSDHLPITPGEIVAESLAAVEAGAAIYIGKGEQATGNAQQVRKIREVLTDLGRPVATPADARRMLALKGGENVKL